MAPYRIPHKNSPISLYQVQKGETLKRWYPQSPPQNDHFFNRKTHGCWVPPFFPKPPKSKVQGMCRSEQLRIFLDMLYMYVETQCEVLNDPRKQTWQNLRQMNPWMTFLDQIMAASTTGSGGFSHLTVGWSDRWW